MGGVTSKTGGVVSKMGGAFISNQYVEYQIYGWQMYRVIEVTVTAACLRYALCD